MGAATRNRRQRSSSSQHRSSAKPADVCADSLLPQYPIVRWGECTHPHRTYPMHNSPHWMYAANPHICRHYRAEMDVRSCARSLFSWHNETVNFWTHTIAVIGILAYAAILNFVYFPSLLDLSRPSHIVTAALINLNVVASVCCLGFSAAFHGFLCCGRDRYTFLSRLDYTGISIILVGSFLAPYWVAFHCTPLFVCLYSGVLVVSGSIILVLPWHPAFSSPKFAVGRSIAYAVVASQALIPLLHGSQLPFRQVPELTRLFALEFFLYGIGALFYISKVPERLCPRTFDLVGSSHQLFHLFVAAAVATHLRAVTVLVPMMVEMDCSAVRAASLW